MAIRAAELNRRVQVTATKSWGPTLTESVGREVDSQVAAPTETRTPNLHRANIAHKRVRMEGWRQRRLGSKEDHSTNKGNYKTDLTLTGLLMEGLGPTHIETITSAKELLRQLSGRRCNNILSYLRNVREHQASMFFFQENE